MVGPVLLVQEDMRKKWTVTTFDMLPPLSSNLNQMRQHPEEEVDHVKIAAWQTRRRNLLSNITKAGLFATLGECLEYGKRFQAYFTC